MAEAGCDAGATKPRQPQGFHDCGSAYSATMVTRTGAIPAMSLTRLNCCSRRTTPSLATIGASHSLVSA